MELTKKLKEVVDVLSLHYKLEVLSDEETGSNEREVSVRLDTDVKITVSDIEAALEVIKGADFHVVVYKNIVAILVDVHEPHTV